jgi:glutathione synthase
VTGAARLDVVVVMDGPETVTAATDTSFGMLVAAAERGHRCWHCGPADLSAVGGTVRARVRSVDPDAQRTDPMGLGAVAEVDLRDVDVVLVRPDPPFDQTYLHLTLLLDVVAADTLVVNSPTGLRQANEKLYALRFPEVTPPTVVTADRDLLMAFAAEHDAAVVKPIDGHGGRSVLVVRPDDENAASILDTVTERGAAAVVAQRYLPGVRDGDKRVLLLDGEPLGAILRRPAGADFRANICVGGTVEAVELDAADQRIVDAMAPSLRADGLHFVGIDVVDGHLTEVNVTSPTGLRQLGSLSGTRPDLTVIRWIEDRCRDRRRPSPVTGAPASSGG